MDAERSIDLITKAQSGDEDALNRLLARYGPRLQRWASGRLPASARDMTDTADLVQEALIGAVRNLSRFELRAEWAMQGYLRRAVTNRIRDELRRRNRTPAKVELGSVIPDPEASPLEAALGREVFERYERALDSLDEPDREAVIARIELGCSYAEIAALLEKPTPDAARVMTARALSRVARLMA
jgi:RNA polymerase sigma-70 factor (ECF subfamily)